MIARPQQAERRQPTEFEDWLPPGQAIAPEMALAPPRRSTPLTGSHPVDAAAPA
jgi:hypothetical protein